MSITELPKTSFFSLKNSYLTVVKNGGLIILAKLGVFIISFGLMAGFGHFASKTTLGFYNYIIAVLTIISIATLPGMNSALIKAISRGKEGSFLMMAKMRVTTGIIGSFIALAVGAYYLYNGNMSLGYSFLIAAPFVPLTDTLSDLSLLYWQGRRNFKKSLYVNILYQLLFSIPSLITLLLTDRIELIILSFFSFQAVAGFLIYKNITPENNERDGDSESFGRHLTVMYAFRIISTNIDRITVWYLFGPITVAIYTFASTPINKIEQLIPIEQLALPALSTTTLTVERKKFLLRRTGLLFLLTIPALLLLYVLAPFFYSMLFPNFMDSIPIFRMLLVTIAFSPILLLRTSLIAWRKQSQLYILEILFPIVKIIGIIAGGMLFGITGIVIGICIAKIIDTIATLLLFQKI